MLVPSEIPASASTFDQAELNHVVAMEQLTHLGALFKAIACIPRDEPGAIVGDLRGERCPLAVALVHKWHNEADRDSTHVTWSEP